jgi:hypothetical protein
MISLIGLVNYDFTDLVLITPIFKFNRCNHLGNHLIVALTFLTSDVFIELALLPKLLRT